MISKIEIDHYQTKKESRKTDRNEIVFRFPEVAHEPLNSATPGVVPEI